jgi:hypothetical protein
VANIESAREYWKEVEEIARDCAERARDEDRELSEVVWETVDSHQWVIYNAYHYDVLRHTDQDVGARFEDMGGPSMKDGWEHVVLQAAFLALEGDVMEEAQDIFLSIQPEESDE